MSMNYLEQIDLLTICCYRDRGGKTISAICPTTLYEPAEVRNLADKLYAYIDEHHCPPKDLFINMIEELRERYPDDEDTYDHIQRSILDAKTTVNEDYTVPKLRRFMRTQNMSLALRRIIELHNAGDDEAAMHAMVKAADERDAALDPGLDLNLLGKFVGPQHREQNDSFETGIEILDKHRVTPARKEMLMFVAPAKHGKTFAMVQFGKRAMLQRKKVCHVTLEMSQEEIMYRYVRTMTTMGDADTITRPWIQKDEEGKFLDCGTTEVPNPARFGTDEGDRVINKFLRKFKGRLPLKIKEFPSGQLSVMALRKWLRALESVHNYVPDLLLVDYPDLMKEDQSSNRDYRIQLDKILVGLRGIASEMACAVVVASQTNRDGAHKKNVRAHDVAESFGKVMTFDKGIFYSQTDDEKKANLARLFVLGRNVKSSFEFLISQCYDTNTFAVDCAYIDKDCYPPRGSPDRDSNTARSGRQRVPEREAEDDGETAVAPPRGRAQGRARPDPVLAAYSGSANASGHV